MSIEKLLKNSTIKKTNTLDKSLVFNPAAVVTTNLPILNLALSGDINGGFLPGLIQLAGPSKHFKSNLALLMLSAYLNKYKDGVCLFYDSEFGAKESYFKSFGIDPARIVHSPLLNVEQLKFDMMAQLDGLTDKDKVIVIIDSVGNLASKKEVEDALKQNSAADMSRAKAFKSFFRMVTPQLHDKGITLIAIAHIYMSQELYAKPKVSGGCLVAGTKLRMFDDTLKSIEDILCGDLVLTLDGPKVVTHTWNPDTLTDGEPECYKITFEDGHEVVCSDSHPFLLNGEFVAAEQLKIDDNITVV